jgi:hypothetical protein
MNVSLKRLSESSSSLKFRNLSYPIGDYVVQSKMDNAHAEVGTHRAINIEAKRLVSTTTTLCCWYSLSKRKRGTLIEIEAKA